MRKESEKEWINVHESLHRWFSCKSPPAMQEMQETLVWSLGWDDPLEEEMAVHSSILAWRIPWTKEPGGLQSMWSHRVGHDWALSISTYVYLWLNHFIVHLKLTQHCKSTMLVVWWFSRWVVSSWLPSLIHLVLSFHGFPFFLKPWIETLGLNHFFSSVQFSRSVVSDSLQPHGLQHTGPCSPSPAPGAWTIS